MDGVIGLVVIVGIFYFIVLPIIVFNSSSKINQLNWQLSQLSDKLKKLTESAVKTEAEAKATVSETPVEAAPPLPERSPISVPAAAAAPPASITAQPTHVATVHEMLLEKKTALQTAPSTPPAYSPMENPFEALLKKALHWFIKDNPLAKIGVLVLFFGIGYLIKYSIDNAVLPIEWRLLSAVLISVGLLAFGWRLRDKNLTFSLILQGGAIGSLYIVILGSFRFFDLIPATLCFALLCVVCLCCITLSLLQNARSLAIMALLGGYAAPLLVSTGSGNPIALFAFYQLLSLVALVLAVKKVWRELVYLAFLLTLSVACLWGWARYVETDYLFCQMFILSNLAVFGFLYPLGLPRRTSLDYVLLLSVPCIAFGLQYLIQASEWVNALSALALSAVYLGLVYVAIRQRVAWMAHWEKMTRLCLLLLGVSFLSLSVPLALSAQWTAFFWALEGLIVLHLGLTQKERYFQVGGLALLVFSLFSLGYAFNAHPFTLLSYLVSLAVLSLCWLVAAYDWQRLAADQHPSSRFIPIQWGLLGVSMGVWCLTILNVDSYLPIPQPIDGFALSFGLFLLSIAFWVFVSHRLQWRALNYSGLLLWPVLLLAMAYQFIFWGNLTQFGSYSLLWLLAFAMTWGYLRYVTLSKAVWWHISLYWLSVAFLLLNVLTLDLNVSWQHLEIIQTCGMLVILSVGILLPLRAQHSQCWPVALFPQHYTFTALLPLLGLICLTALYSLTFDGYDISNSIVGVSYIPLLNLLDLSVALGLLTLVYWLINQQIALLPYLSQQKIVLFCALLIALFLNATILRAVAYYNQVEWYLDDLLHSDLIQFTLTLIWTLFAVSLVLWANKTQHRPAWLAGITVIIGVVIKLFLVDSAQTSGIIRAVIFISVALFILVISYFAPLPPRHSRKESEHEEQS